MRKNFINHSYNRENANNIKNESQSEQMNFSKFMRNLILDGIIELAKSYDILAKSQGLKSTNNSENDWLSRILNMKVVLCVFSTLFSILEKSSLIKRVVMKTKISF